MRGLESIDVQGLRMTVFLPFPCDVYLAGRNHAHRDMFLGLAAAPHQHDLLLVLIFDVPNSKVDDRLCPLDDTLVQADPPEQRA